MDSAEIERYLDIRDSPSPQIFDIDDKCARISRTFVPADGLGAPTRLFRFSFSIQAIEHARLKHQDSIERPVRDSEGSFDKASRPRQDRFRLFDMAFG
jgi:hypothetical protein